MSLGAELAERLAAKPSDPRAVWHGKARPDQLLPPQILNGEDRVIYWQGGRGSGKTASGAGAMADLVLEDSDGEGEYAIVAPTYADAWTKCVEGEAGILQALGTSMAEIKAHTSKTVVAAWRTYGQVILHNGCVIYADSAAEGGLRIQGRNLKAAWCDEIGLWLNWEVAWNESLRYAVRRGRSIVICTGTPKASRPARKLIRSLIRNEPEHGGVVVRRLRTIDNIDNLSPAFYRSVVGAVQGTRLERQELEGELLDDVANALWTRDMLERCQADPPPHLRRVCIGVDMSDGNETSDEQAYTVAGTGPADDKSLYVLENWGGQEAPVAFARRVITRALELSTDGCEVMLVLEKNHGGAWMVATFEQVMKEIGRVPYQVIHASHAKRTRAEPVSAMYERDGGQLMKHAPPRDGHGNLQPFTELEDQMATFTGASKERSPDRLDSLVWAVSPFLNATFGPEGKRGPRKWALQHYLDEQFSQSESERLRRRLAGMTATQAGQPDEVSWDLDNFAPGDDDELPDHVARGSRSNIRTWR